MPGGFRSAGESLAIPAAPYLTLTCLVPRRESSAAGCSPSLGVLAVSFLQEWQAAKTKFERVTQTKKPGDKFLGIYRKSSGMETACKALDEAFKKGLRAGMTKARTDFDAAARNYSATLVKAEADAKEVNLKTELTALNAALHTVGERFTLACTLYFDGMWKRVKVKIVAYVNECNDDFKDFEGFLKLCQDKLGAVDEQVRAIIEANAAKDAIRAKTLGAGVAPLAKEVTDLVDKAVRRRAFLVSRRTAVMAGWVKEAGVSFEVAPHRTEYDRFKDRFDVAHAGMDEKLESLQTLKAEAESLKGQAAAALRGSLDVEKTYDESCKRLKKQTELAVQACVSGMLALEGRLDGANFDRMQAVEKLAAGSDELRQSDRKIDVMLAHLLRDTALQETRLEKTRADITSRWAALPEAIRTNPKFVPYGTRLERYRVDVGQILDRVGVLRAGVARLQAKLAK